MIIKRSLRSSMPAPNHGYGLSDDDDDDLDVDRRPRRKRPRPDPLEMLSSAAVASSSADPLRCSGEVEPSASRRRTSRGRSQVLRKRFSDSVLIDPKRTDSRTLESEKLSSLRPDSIALYGREEGELYWACKNIGAMDERFPPRPPTHRRHRRRLPIVAVDGEDTLLPPPPPCRRPTRPSRFASANTIDAAKMDRLYRKKKRVSDSSSSSDEFPASDAERSPKSSSETDPESAEASAELVTRVRLGPEEVLPDTAEEIYRAHEEIPEIDSTLVAGGADAVFVDCLHSGARKPLPPQAWDFELKREISGRKAEKEYLQLKEQVMQRYQSARAEILRRFPNQPRAPKSGRSGNNPNTKKPPKGKRVVIQWNEFGQPVGDWGNSFNNYLGCLAKRADLFNPYFMWPNQPFNRLKAAWRDLEKYFVMDGNPNAWTYVFTAKIPKMIQEFKTNLKKTYFEKYQYDWQRFWHLDPRADGVQFAALCYYWETDSAKRKSDICKANREKHDMEHHGGSASFSQLLHKNKASMRVDEIAKIAYGKFSPKYDNEEKKKKKLEIVDALLRSIQEATLQSQPHSDGESGNALELPVDVQDRCVQNVFGPSKKNRYRLRGVGARKPIQSSESSTTSVTELSSDYEPGVSRKEFLEFKKNTEEMLQMRLKERELMISMASSLPLDQRERWMTQIALLWGSSDGGSSGQKTGDGGVVPSQEKNDNDGVTTESLLS